MSGLTSKLRRTLGDETVVTDGLQLDAVSTDYTGRFSGNTDLLLRPKTPAQVAEAVQLLAEAGRPFVAQGGNTGLVGGSVPVDGEAVLSLAAVDTLGAVDVDARQVTAGAGVTLQQVDDTARQHGLRLGVQIASRSAATVGGAVATNAGGTRVLRHGPMRDQIAGLQAVLGNGDVLQHMQGLDKDNTGVRWDRMLCGSEGTLGVVTQARLQLVPAADKATVVVAAVESVAAAVALVGHLRRQVPTLESAELMLDDGIGLVCGQLGLPELFTKRYPAYVLAEAADVTDPTDQLAGAYDTAPCDVFDVAVGTAAAEREKLWAYRELHTEAISRVAKPVKCDVAVPHTQYATFAAAVDDAARACHPDVSTVRFGHIADGNLHVNVLDVPEDVDAAGAVFEVVAAHDGSISAEHGIGRLKAPWWHLNRTEAELRFYRQLRQLADPQGVCNPNVMSAN